MNTQPKLRIIETEIYNQQEANNTNLIANSFIENKCNELIVLKRQIAVLDKAKEELETAIKDYMQDKEELTNNLGHIIATWKTSITKTLDQKKLKESGFDLEPFYTEKQKRTFLIK